MSKNLLPIYLFINTVPGTQLSQKTSNTRALNQELSQTCYKVAFNQKGVIIFLILTKKK
jgi:hypothetical protein